MRIDHKKNLQNHTRRDTTIATARGFAVVVTDKNGLRFVRTRVNGHPSATLICPEATPVTEQISHDIVWFHNEAIAECYGKDTIDLVKLGYMGTKIYPKPPFIAKVVPLTFKLG